MLCGCPRDRLCDACVAGAMGHLGGVAACRGEFWAMRVSERTRRRPPWPPFDGRAAEIAMMKVADLTTDPRLAELLAREVMRWAARWWREHASARR